MDSSMPMPGGDSEKEILQPDTDIPVRLDSLEADGTRPSVGDQVTIKIDGTVKSIKDDCAYISPDKVNDTDLEEILAEHENQDEDGLMERLTAQADQAGTPIGGGDYG